MQLAPTENFGASWPGRLAALGGLLVGTISALCGIDLWTALARAGLAFACFGALGLLARNLLRPPAEPTPTVPAKAPEPR